MKKKHNLGRHYDTAKELYVDEARKCFDQFLFDELGEDFCWQLRYEAACEGLRVLERKITSMGGGRERRQMSVFYEEKRKQLEEKAFDYEQTPYTL